jgi:hypothetical protein
MCEMGDFFWGWVVEGETNEKMRIWTKRVKMEKRWGRF